MTKRKAKPKPVDLSQVDVDVLIKELEGRGEAIPPTNGYNMATYDDDMKALIVVESRAIGPSAAAKKYGLSKERVYLWRQREEADQAFKKRINLKKSEFTADFSLEAAGAIRSVLAFITRAGEVMDPEVPANVRAQAGALKMVAEFKLAFDVVYAKIDPAPSSPQLSATTTSEGNAEYNIAPADEIVEGDFADLKEIQE